jgi:hypothetical protein
MKKQIITAALLFTVTMFINSCGSNNSETKTERTEQIEIAKYQCPMKCEGEKTYNKPGQCPKCNMDLQKVEEMDEQHNHDSTHTNH